MSYKKQINKRYTPEELRYIQQFEKERYDAYRKYCYKTLAAQLGTTPHALSEMLYRIRSGIRDPKK